MRLLAAVVITSLVILSSASARDIVIERGTGRDCYLATLRESSPDNDRQGLAVCNAAVSAYGAGSYNLAASLVNRAEILLRMRRFAEAVTDSDRAIAIAPDLGAALTNRGAALLGLMRYDEAIAVLDRAIVLGGERLELAYYNRGLAKDHQGDAKGAYLDYSKALELKPDFEAPKAQLPRFHVTYQPR
ncbi:MAG: hypothetical protein JO256_09395 [Alphaproteobacteria bacterium]|nr:hypothetical protein [Alphaproteobacteria bacterium]